jgi:alkyldihydroxyacetonephosphate synthase
MQAIAESEAAPTVTRVSDSFETAFSFSTRKDPTPLDRVKSKALTTYLERRRGYDLEAMCLSFIGYEGSKAHVASQRKLVGRIVSRFGGLCIGSSPGELYDQKKFDTPYIRDFLLDRGAPADVSETSAPWSALRPLYDNVMAAAHGSFADLGVTGYIMCHLSHSYHAGACLYFTFAFNPSGTREAIDEYDVVKTAIQQAFVDSGATLSHHHAVGTEHAQWLEEDISPAGVTMVRALFDGVDPGANLNPGKIVGVTRPTRS